MEKEREMNTCIVCGEKFNVEDTKRFFGDMHWIFNQCSPICHTKYVRALTFFVKDLESNNEVFNHHGKRYADEKLLEIAKEKTIKLLEILR